MSWHFEGRFTSKAKAKAALNDARYVPRHVVDSLAIVLAYLPEPGLNQHVHVLSTGHISRTTGNEHGTVRNEVHIHLVES